MFDEPDTYQEEVAVTSGHQVVSPYGLRFVIDCVFDPAQQEKPKCRIKYIKSHSKLDTEEAEIEEEDLDSVEEEMDEAPEKKRKHPKKTKGHKGDAADKDDEDDEDDEDENQPILECISRAYSDE